MGTSSDITELLEKKDITYNDKKITFIKKTTILEVNSKKPIILSIQIYIKDNFLRPILKNELPNSIVEKLMLPNNWQIVKNEDFEKELNNLRESFFTNVETDTFVGEAFSLYYSVIGKDNKKANAIYQLMGLRINEFGKIIGNQTLSFPEIPLIMKCLLKEKELWKECVFLLDNHILLIPITYRNKILFCICKEKIENTQVCLEILNTFTLFKENFTKEYLIILDDKDKRYLILDDKKMKKEMNKKIQKIEGVSG